MVSLQTDPNQGANLVATVQRAHEGSVSREKIFEGRFNPIQVYAGVLIVLSHVRYCFRARPSKDRR